MSALPPKPRYRRRRIFWLILLAAVLLIGIPTAFAAAPTMPWYPVQRLGENMTTALVPVPKVKQGLQAVFAARRVREAKVLAQGMRGQPLKVQEREEKMIGTLLDDYNRAFQEITISLGQQVDRGDKPPTGLFTTIENASTHLYLQLEDLRMIAPSAAQASVLQAQETAQGNLATLADALDHPPVSSDDAKELTSLVAAGLLSKDDLTKLISGDQSNREFLASLRTAVKNGTLPSNALAMIEYGQVAHYASGSIARFRAEVDFDEMRKIALLIKALTPTGAEKKSIEAALAKYVPGQPVAVGDQGQFLRPILLGFSLAPRLPADLTHLDPVSFEPGRKLFYETWKPLTTSKATDAKTLYSQALSLVDQNVARNTDLLEQIEFEVLNALRHDVVYAALPPGWTQEQVIKIQPAFKQLITDARTAETLQKQTAATTTSLIGMTAPLAVTLSNKQVEALRQETKSAMADMKKQLTALSMGVAVPNDTVTTINKKLDDLNTHVDQSLQGMTTSAAPATLTQEVAELRASLKQALDAAHTAMSDVQQQVATNVGISGALKQALTDLSTAHDQTRTELSRHVTALTQASGATAKMQQTVTDIMADSGKNVAALSSQITDALKSQATLKASLSQSIQDQADHAAELKAQLELSDAARQALKDEVVSTISTVKTAQDAVV
ncbi:MAG: hypothetical protein HY092_00135, partial [Candidatus Kerfeldbacteria bacterium]|nr:hypothetical protein [Candidatus Kerfeldbacteria bacterium]